MEIVNRVRALIISDGKLLVFKHRPTSDSYALPGGHLEPGETLEEGMAREILEETGIRAAVGKLVAVYQLLKPEKNIHSLEFFFQIKNSQDFFHQDLTGGSHSREIFEYKFMELADDRIKILPAVARKLAKDIVTNGEAEIVTKLLRSESN